MEASSNVGFEVMLSISTNGYDWSPGKSILFVQKHEVFSVYPNSGSFLGNTTIIVTGQHFLPSKELGCRFGYVKTGAVYISSTKLKCMSPEYVDFGGNSTIPLEITINGYEYSSSLVMYSYMASIAITSINPLFGPSSGGTNVSVHFKIFPIENLPTPVISNASEAFCRFRDFVVPAYITGLLQLSCLTPSINALGDLVQLEVSLNNRVDWTTDEFFFMFSPGQMNEFVSLSPDHGPVCGGTLVRLDGLAGILPKTESNASLAITDEALCKFDDITFPISDAAIDGSYIVCESPQVNVTLPNESYSIKVEVSLNGAEEDFLALGVIFTYDPIVYISRIQPCEGPYTGNLPIRVIGGPFFDAGDELYCRFGALKVHATWLSNNVVECIAPTYEEVKLSTTLNYTKGYVPVSVSLNGGHDFSMDDHNFRYIPIHAVEKVSPPNGPIDGGTSIVVQSTQLELTKRLFCHFKAPDRHNEGSSLIVSVSSVLNDTNLVCITPPSLKAGKFVVTITTVPTMDLFSAFSFNEYDKYGSFFSYDNRLEVSKLHPCLGPVTGNFPVSIIGGPFLDSFQIKCGFGDFVVQGRVLNSHEIECIAPPNTMGDKVFALSANGLDFDKTDVTFFYHDIMELSYLNPKLGPASKAGSLILITGKGFTNSTRLTCKFDSILVPGQFISNQAISCKSPPIKRSEMEWLSLSYLKAASTSIEDLFPNMHGYPLYSGKLSSIQVSNNGQDYAMTKLSYLYHDDVEVCHVYNYNGPSIGGTPVFVRGNGFVNTTQLKCRFGYNEVEAHFLSRNCVLCFSPSYSINQLSSFEQIRFIANPLEEMLHMFHTSPQGNETNFVEVSNNGFDFSFDGKSFQYSETDEEGFYQPGVEEVRF